MRSGDYQAVIDTPIHSVPQLGLRIDGTTPFVVDFLFEHLPPYCNGQHEPVCRALHEYLWQGGTLPVPQTLPAGTSFQRRVWQALLTIPTGETRSYGELARQLHSSARAVAGACRANPLPLYIPCHRVVSANGLGGYLGEQKGQGPAIKQWLLDNERSH